MALATVVDWQARLDSYLAAETAVLRNQSYQIGDRELHRADLSEIRKGIQECQAMINGLTRATSGRSRTRYIVAG